MESELTDWQERRAWLHTPPRSMGMGLGGEVGGLTSLFCIHFQIKAWVTKLYLTLLPSNLFENILKVYTQNVQFSEGLISIPNLNIFPYRKNNTKLAFTGGRNGCEYLANVTILLPISNNIFFTLFGKLWLLLTIIGIKM